MKSYKQKFKQIQYLLLDMDGTVYLGDKLIGDVKNTLNRIRQVGKKLIFLTNNSSKSVGEYREKLSKLGIYDSSDFIYTSGIATINYILQNFPNRSVYLVGTSTLKKEFLESGINLTENLADIVVIGYDTTLTYEKLVKATNYITKGALYIATHPDINCPAEDVYLPDVGSFMSLIKTSTGKEPSVICGKPFKFMGDTIKNKFKADSQNILMIGDRLSTDIKFAINNSFHSALVLSGETDEKMYNESSVKADFVLEDINELTKYL